MPAIPLVRLHRITPVIVVALTLFGCRGHTIRFPPDVSRPELIRAAAYRVVVDRDSSSAWMLSNVGSVTRVSRWLAGTSDVDTAYVTPHPSAAGYCGRDLWLVQSTTNTLSLTRLAADLSEAEVAASVSAPKGGRFSPLSTLGCVAGVPRWGVVGYASDGSAFVVDGVGSSWTGSEVESGGASVLFLHDDLLVWDRPPHRARCLRNGPACEATVADRGPQDLWSAEGPSVAARTFPAIGSIELTLGVGEHARTLRLDDGLDYDLALARDGHALLWSGAAWVLVGPRAEVLDRGSWETEPEAVGMDGDMVCLGRGEVLRCRERPPASGSGR